MQPTLGWNKGADKPSTTEQANMSNSWLKGKKKSVSSGKCKGNLGQQNVISQVGIWPGGQLLFWFALFQRCKVFISLLLCFWIITSSPAGWAWPHCWFLELSVPFFDMDRSIPCCWHYLVIYDSPNCLKGHSRCPLQGQDIPHAASHPRSVSLGIPSA